MKKLLLSMLFVSLILVGCSSDKTNTETANSTKEEVVVSEESQTATASDVKEDVTEEVTEEVVNDDEPELSEDFIDPIEYTDIENSDGIKVSFMSDTFSRADYETDSDNSITILCEVDPAHKNENYINLLYTDEFSADDLYEGLKLQGTDINVIEDNATIDGIDGKVLQYQVSDDFQLTFFVLPHLNGAYKIEIGAHLYSDDEDSIAYQVSGVMDDFLVNCIQLEK